VKKSSHTHYGTLNELNITPLLDLAFVDITKVGLATAW
jgi:biopolymer transport protein ExbD